MQAKRNAVWQVPFSISEYHEEKRQTFDVSLHAVEDFAGHLDGRDDSRQTLVEEDNVGSGTGSVCGTFDGNTAIGALEGRCIVGTVTEALSAPFEDEVDDRPSHGHQMMAILQELNNLVLVLGIDFAKAVGGFDKIVDCGARHAATADQLLRIVNLGADTELLARLDGNGHSVTSQHLHLDAESTSFANGGSGVSARRIKHAAAVLDIGQNHGRIDLRQETEQAPLVVLL